MHSSHYVHCFKELCSTLNNDSNGMHELLQSATVLKIALEIATNNSDALLAIE
ncbi:MAG: hypothetical protein ACI8RD_011806 [Bacillariaceae sp.]|jgi:hypothetical protein